MVISCLAWWCHYYLLFPMADKKRTFCFSFCPPSAVCPFVRPKKLLLTLPLSDVRRPTSDLGPIQWGQSYNLDYQLIIRLTPLYRIGPRSDSGGRTEGQSQENFFGRTEGRAADKKRSKNFVLGSPTNISRLCVTSNYPLKIIHSFNTFYDLFRHICMLPDSPVPHIKHNSTEVCTKFDLL